MAAYLAGLSNPPLEIHSVDKANVLATSRLWRRVVTDVMAKEFPHIKLDHSLVDSAAMVICSNPRKLNGILLSRYHSNDWLIPLILSALTNLLYLLSLLAENLFGDILSDETSVIPGSLGLLPSISLAGIPNGTDKIASMSEPIHGSAPDIAGQSIANPIGTILSLALMFRYTFGREKEAKIIEEAVRIVLDDVEVDGFGFRTRDLGGTKSTTEMGDKVVEVLTGLLK